MYAKCTRNVREMYGYPTVTPPGPRGLHFRGRRPVAHLPELAHAAACGLKPAAQPRDAVFMFGPLATSPSPP